MDIISKLGEMEIGIIADGYKGVHEGFGYGSRNPERFKLIHSSRDRRLVTYQSGNSSSQLDYILVRKSNRIMVNKDVKVVASEHQVCKGC